MNSYWYLGSPYGKYPFGTEKAFQDVCVEAGRLICAKIPIYSPIAHTHPISLYGKIPNTDNNIWLPADKPLMESAHGLIILKLESWENSLGLKHEFEYFQSVNKPILYMTPGIIPEQLIKEA